MAGFFGELKRRKVYRVAAAYAVVSWLIIQVATQVFPFLEIPNWTVRLVIAVLVLGFPVALLLSWAFDLTPQGIKRTPEVAEASAKQSAAVPARDIPEKSVAGALVETNAAAIYAQVGQTDRAIAELQRLVALPGGPTRGLLRAEPEWDPLRGDSRFAVLARGA